MLTWQIAREAVGGVCKPDPPEPGAGVDEACLVETVGEEGI